MDASPTTFGPELFMDYNVILAAVNYRLGVLGFLTSGDEGAPGNLGLRDQAAALEFIKREALALGGDPDRVTLFGSGAGAKSALLQATSPINRGKKLFRRIIAQSGSPMMDMKAEGKAKKAKQVFALGKRVGCKKSAIEVRPPEIDAMCAMFFVC